MATRKKSEPALRKSKPLNFLVLSFTRDGCDLSVRARDALELQMYSRLAKQNLKPMTRHLGWSHGAVITIDLDTGATQTVWSRLGPDAQVEKLILAWLKKNASPAILANWKGQR